MNRAPQRVDLFLSVVQLAPELAFTEIFRFTRE